MAIERKHYPAIRIPSRILAILALMTLPVAARGQAPEGTQFWLSELVAFTQVGTGARGEPHLRSVRLAVIAPEQREGNNFTPTECLQDAYGTNSETRLNEMLARSLDAAYREWKKDPKRVPPHRRVLEQSDLAAVYTETILDSTAVTFSNAISKVQVALAEIDSAFRDRLARVPECNPLAKSAHLALVQRVCPPVAPSCGQQAGEQIGGRLAENRSASRFEMLMAWGAIVQGNALQDPASDRAQRKTLLKAHVPIVFGVLARSEEGRKALAGFNNKAGLATDPVISEASEVDRQRALERAIARRATHPYQIPASVLLTLDIPVQIGIRFAQMGLVENAAFAMANARKDKPDATLIDISDDVARRRVVDCVVLQSVSSSQVQAVSECAGYNFASTTEITNCLQSSMPCRPKIQIEKVAQGAALMVGTSTQINRLLFANLLPRIRTGGVTYDGLANVANAKCANVASVEADFAKCLLINGMGGADRDAWAKCLLSERASAGTTTPLSAKEMSNAVECFAKSNKTLGDPKQVAATLKCVDGMTNTAVFQKCLAETLLPPEALAAKRCLAAAASADQFACFLKDVAKTPVAKIEACAKERDRQACLVAVLPDGAKKLQELQAKCRQGNSATELLGCATAAGIPIDPKISKAVTCTSNGMSVAAATCFAADDIKGPIGDLARCYSDSMSGGGASAVAACMAGRALGLNQDFQMLAQCAAASGGEPVSTGTCTFGKLALRELANCKGKHFGDDQCFGKNNTLRKTLGIGENSEVAKLINIQLDIVNGVFAFAENPGKATEETLRNAGRELTVFRNNVYREVNTAAEKFKSTVSTVVGPGVYTKVDHRGIEVGSIKIRW